LPLPNAKEKVMEIVFYDDNIIVINKPNWLLSVPGNKYETEDSAVQRLQPQFGKIHVVHRLDCATSGILLFARNLSSEIELHRQFREREVSKKYMALIYDSPSQERGEVNAPLIAKWGHLPLQKVDFEKGKKSLTKWNIKKTLIFQRTGASLIELIPVTGRRHQLRLHMQYLGNPIIGDRLYGSTLHKRKKHDRMYLHSAFLQFKHPVSHEVMQFEKVHDFLADN